MEIDQIPARHAEIDRRLCDWSRWVRVSDRPWKTASIWRQYRAPRQYAYETQDIPVAINVLETWEIEKTVSELPDKHRDAIRWCYVWPWVHEGKIRRELGVTHDALVQLINDARDMVVNRLK